MPRITHYGTFSVFKHLRLFDGGVGQFNGAGCLAVGRTGQFNGAFCLAVFADGGTGESVTMMPVQWPVHGDTSRRLFYLVFFLPTVSYPGIYLACNNTDVRGAWYLCMEGTSIGDRVPNCVTLCRAGTYLIGTNVTPKLTPVL